MRELRRIPNTVVIVIKEPKNVVLAYLFRLVFVQSVRIESQNKVQQLPEGESDAFIDIRRSKTLFLLQEGNERSEMYRKSEVASSFGQPHRLTTLQKPTTLM